MSARHAPGDVVVARAEADGPYGRWQEAIVREVHHVETWIEYKVAFRLKSGGWANRVRWAEVQGAEARR